MLHFWLGLLVVLVQAVILNFELRHVCATCQQGLDSVTHGADFWVYTYLHAVFGPVVQQLYLKVLYIEFRPYTRLSLEKSRNGLVALLVNAKNVWFADQELVKARQNDVKVLRMADVCKIYVERILKLLAFQEFGLDFSIDELNVVTKISNISQELSWHLHQIFLLLLHAIHDWSLNNDLLGLAARFHLALLWNFVACLWSIQTINLADLSDVPSNLVYPLRFYQIDLELMIDEGILEEWLFVGVVPHRLGALLLPLECLGVELHELIADLSSWYLEFPYLRLLQGLSATFRGHLHRLRYDWSFLCQHWVAVLASISLRVQGARFIVLVAAWAAVLAIFVFGECVVVGSGVKWGLLLLLIARSCWCFAASWASASGCCASSAFCSWTSSSASSSRVGVTGGSLDRWSFHFCFFGPSSKFCARLICLFRHFFVFFYFFDFNLLSWILSFSLFLWWILLFSRFIIFLYLDRLLPWNWLLLQIALLFFLNNFLRRTLVIWCLRCPCSLFWPPRSIRFWKWPTFIGKHINKVKKLIFVSLSSCVRSISSSSYMSHFFIWLYWGHSVVLLIHSPLPLSSRSFFHLLLLQVFKTSNIFLCLGLAMLLSRLWRICFLSLKYLCQASQGHKGVRLAWYLLGHVLILLLMSIVTFHF